jgi:type IV fimbrial biogenesis protein FimT
MMIVKTKRAMQVFGLRWKPTLTCGFTLIELMVTITILGILTAFALPSLQNLVLDQQIKSATFDVFSSLVYARSEALKRNSNIDIVATSGNWANGWAVQTQGTVTVLKRQDALGGITLTVTDPANVAVSTITYGRTGRLNNATAPVFVLKVASNISVNPRCVLLDLSGRPNIKVAPNYNPTNQCN